MNSIRSMLVAALAATVVPLAAPAAENGHEVEQLRSEVRMLRERLDAMEALVESMQLGLEAPADPARDFIADVVPPEGPSGGEEAVIEEMFEETPDWLRALREDEATYGLNHRQRQEQLARQSEAAGYAVGEEARELDVDIGGAVWINFAYQDWVGDDEGRKDNLRFDNLRLSVDSSYGDFLMSAQYRFYSYSRALHHAWIGYEFEEENRVELGISQVPFGLLPFASHSFWFQIPYYVGLEDDYDAGIKWHYGAEEDWSFDLAFYLNEEYADATDLDRFSVDVVRDGDQQNDERNQANVRFAYDWRFSERSHAELGVSGRYGALDNRTTEKTGDYWAAAVHANAFFGPWNLMLEALRYEYDPENPAGVDDDLILMGNLGSKRLVASEADIYVANLAYDFGPVWGAIEQLSCYNDYAYMRKDESSFANSQINDTGCVAAMGPFWVWLDLILGKNAWYLNDSEVNSGFGPGGTDDWETRFNLSFEWYF